MLASEMKALSNASRNNNNVITDYFNQAIEEIKKAATEGKNELSIYYLSGYKDYDNRDLFVKKIEDNGFRLVEGWQIGKPMCNSRSKYIVW